MCANSGNAGLVIGKSWSGAAVDADLQASIDLSWDDRRLQLAVEAPFWSDPPPSGPPESTEGLWNFEVVELFLAADDDATRYLEIELGPWGHYLVLLFAGVRRRIAEGIALDFCVERKENRWCGNATLDADHLPGRPWRANAFAVHGQGEQRRYLAAHPLPGLSPDFHQPAMFPRLAG